MREFYSRTPPYPVYSDRAIFLHAFQTRKTSDPVCCVLRSICPSHTQTTNLATSCRIPAVVLRRLFSGIRPTEIVRCSRTIGHPTLVRFLGQPKNRIELTGRLNAILDLAFSPFEDTITAFSDSHFTSANWPWLDFGFQEAVLCRDTRWVYWRGFLLPDSGLEERCGDTHSVVVTPDKIRARRKLVIFSILWRMHVAEVIRIFLQCSARDPDSDLSFFRDLVTMRERDPTFVHPDSLKESRSIDYVGVSLHSRWIRVLSQFQDSHIAILTEMTATGNYSDSPDLLARYYPGLSDSLCSDELPDMTPLLPFSSIWFEHGTKNNPRSAAYVVAHFFLGKTNMQSCQTHSIIDLAYQYCNTTPNFALLLQNVFRASFAGNLAVSRNRLVLAARIRIESALTDPLRSTVNSLALIDVPREKKKHRRRKQQNGEGGECGPDEPSWLAWFRKHQYVLTFLMREWHIQVACDSSEFAKIAEQHVKVRQGAGLVCATAAALRANINRQCIRHTDPRSRISWNIIDGGPDGGDNAGGEKTIIGYAHVQSRLTFMRLRHQSFGDLIWDKCKGVANEPSGRVGLPHNVTREHLQFTAWCFVMRTEARLEPLSMLKALGITEGGFSLLRDMQYAYYEYKCRPAKFQHWIRALYAHSKIDFALVCRFLGYVRRFRKERIFYLPADEKAMQIIQQRNAVPLSPIDATTSNLGVVYHCRVCKSWSASVISTGNRSDPNTFLDTVMKTSLHENDASVVLTEAEKLRTHVTCATACYSDPYTGKVYCKNSRITSESDIPAVPPPDEFRCLRDYFDSEIVREQSCSTTHMRKVYLPGTLQSMGTSRVGLCIFCDTVRKIRVENWTSYGITCGRHDIREHGDDHPISMAYDRLYELKNKK